MAKEVFLCGRLAEVAPDVTVGLASFLEVSVTPIPFLGRLTSTVPKSATRPLFVLHEADRCEARSAFAVIQDIRSDARWMHAPIVVVGDEGPSLPALADALVLALNTRIGWLADPAKLASALATVLEHEKDPPEAVKAARRAETALGEEKFSTAISHLYKALEVAPEFSAAHALLGEAWLRSGDPKKAREFYERALRFNPVDLTALWGLGRCASREKKFAEAVALYEEAARVDTLSLAQRNELGDAYLSVSDTASARAAFESVLAHAPDDGDATAGLGRAALLDHDFALAAKLFEKCRRPDQLATCLNEVGISLANAGQLDRAYEAYQQASAVLGQSKKLHMLEYNIGLAFWRAQRSEDARHWFEKALARNPDYARAKKALASLGS